MHAAVWSELGLTGLALVIASTAVLVVMIWPDRHPGAGRFVLFMALLAVWQFLAGVAGAGLAVAGEVAIARLATGITVAGLWGFSIVLALHRRIVTSHGPSRWWVLAALSLIGVQLGAWIGTLSPVLFGATATTGNVAILVAIRHFGFLQKSHPSPNVPSAARQHDKTSDRCESDERWRFALDGAGDGVWDWNLTTHAVYYSPRLQSMLGYVEGEFRGTIEDWDTRIHPDDRERVWKEWNAYASGAAVEYVSEHRLLRKDGGYLWILDRGTIMERSAEGVPLRAIGTHTDISDRKRAEEALRDGESRLRLALEGADAGIWEWDLQTNRVQWTDQIWNLYGLDRNTVNPSFAAWLDGIRPDQREPLRHSVLASAERGDIINIEWETVPSGGRSRWLMSRGLPVRGDSGRAVSYRGVVLDVTARRMAELALRASEERLRFAIEATSDGLWDWNLETGEVYYSPIFSRMLGFAPGDLPGRITSWENVLHPFDAIQTQRAVNEVVEGSASRFELEYRCRKKGGGWKWVLGRGRAVTRDAQGRARRVIGTHIDITERKNAEAVLGHSHDLMRYIIEHSRSGVAVFDRDMRYVYVSQRYLDEYRITDPTIIGRSHYEIFPEIPEHWRAIHRRSMAGEVLSSEAERFDRKDGHVDWTRWECRPWYGADGSIGGIVLYTEVVTERLRVEEELRESEANFRTFFETLADLVIVADRDGRIIHTNRAARERLGFTVQELSAMTMSGLHGEEHFVSFSRNRDELLSGNMVDCHAALSSKEGGIIPVESRVWVGRWNGQECIFHVSKDLTAEQEAENRFEHLFRSNPALMALTALPTHEFSDVNDAWLNTLGYVREEVIGKTAEELDLFADPESQAEATRMLMNTGRIADLEIQVRRKDGALLNGLFSGEVIEIQGKEYLHTLMIDISERKKAEREIRELNADLERRVAERTAQLKESEQSLRAVFEAAPLPLAIFEPSLSTATLLNESAVALAGGSTAGHWNRAFLANLIGPGPKKQLLDLLQVTGSVRGFELEIRTPEAGRRWFAMSVGPVRLPEGEALIAGLHDITDRKEAENLLREGKVMLQQANAELERALRLKDEFLANMSHELRTPLSAILNMAELLVEQIPGPVNERQRQYLETVNESGRHLLNLINDILDLAKIEAGMMTLDINAVDLRTVCESSYRLVKEIAGRKGVVCTLDLDPQVRFLQADGKRLKQMLVNLLNNAVKFTPAGRGAGLRVVGDRGNRTVAITVWDKGIGIAPADIPRLFKPFVQLDSRLAREHAGTGLGLAIVAQIARGLGGEVSVDSRPGEGSRFVVTLPWDPDRTLAPRSEDDVATEEKSTGPADRRRTILMIEDTEVVAKVTKDYLQAAGYRILQASDGVAGITMARESRPDLILMDVQLPGLDGVEAARRIHEDPVMRKVPIVALTALAMPGDRERCLEAGMAEYVSKPVGLRQLGEIVKRNLA